MKIRVQGEVIEIVIVRKKVSRVSIQYAPFKAIELIVPSSLSDARCYELLQANHQLLLNTLAKKRSLETPQEKIVRMIDGVSVSITILRKTVKNLTLRISQDGQVFISAHHDVPMIQIEQFLDSRMDWLAQKLKTVEEKSEKTSLDFNDGIYFLGSKKSVEIVVGNKNGVVIQGEKCIIYTKKNTEKAILTVFYEFAAIELLKICDELRGKWEKVLVDYRIDSMPTIIVKVMKGKWGLCTPSKALIAMNVKLIHYRVEIIDSVLFHEYVHMIVPNHSKRFYQILDYHMPQYKLLRKEL